MRRTNASLLVVAGSLAAALCGCDGARDGGSPQLFRNPFQPRGVEWTILCMEFRGMDCERNCERTAEALRRSPGIRPQAVYTQHENDRSRLYYGRYRRRGDKATGKFESSAQMQADATLIKDFTVDGGRFFLESRVMPAPTPDVGDPRWELRRNPGVYALRVALFYAEPGFSARKKAAADYCAELRKRGHEAWYRHGDFTSEVFVGSFGEDALVTQRKSGVLASVPGPAVVAMQRNVLFRYELHNCKTLGSGDGRQRWYRASRVVPVLDPYEVDLSELPW